MISKPLFSIILPVHNGGEFIRETIDTIIKQDYPHFDLIILENASTDQTLTVIKQFNDSRIHVVTTSQLLSIEANWARMLDLELNEYMTIVCHDDPLLPSYLSEMVNLIEAEPTASIYHSHFQLIDEQNQVIRNCHPIPYKETCEQFLNHAHLNQEDLVGTGYTMRSRDFKAIGGFPNLPRLLFADVLCWALLSNISYKVCSPAYSYQFRIHTKSTGRLTTIDTFCIAGKAYLEAIKSLPHNHKIAVDFIENFIKLRCRLWLFDIMRSSDSTRFDQYNEVKSLVKQWSQQDRFIDVYAFPV